MGYNYIITLFYLDMIILVTSAEIDLMKDLRTDEYVKTIEWMKENASNYNVIWLECISETEPSYLKGRFPCYCSKSHNSSYLNKGSNLGNALKTFFNDCEVDDSFVIQMTGRYHFLDTYFFDIINNNPGYDLYAKNDGHDQYFTGCFAIKKTYLIEWVNETDWDYLNYSMTNIEKSLWNFVKEKNLKCYEVDSIHMDCNIFGTGQMVRGIV